MNATEQIERAQNAADIRAGRERLESGQVVRRDELRVGDIIMGAGEVTYVHNFNGGQYTRVLIDADPSTTTLGDCDDAGNTIRPSEVKVTIEPRTLDMDAHYSVDGYRGIAFYLLGYVECDTPDTEWSGEREIDTDTVRAVMVGDDREHEIDVNELTLISDDDYCPECGQIGCGHGR